jgi:hypothetical protein
VYPGKQWRHRGGYCGPYHHHGKSKKLRRTEKKKRKKRNPVKV